MLHRLHLDKFAFLLSLCFCISFYSCQEDETCFDGILNQDETEIDCGGVCMACEPIDCSVGLANDFSYTVDGIAMDVDSISAYIEYNRLNIEVHTADPMGDMLIAHPENAFQSGDYIISLMFYHSEYGEYHIITAGSTGTISFSEFSTDANCPYVSGTIESTLHEYQIGGSVDISVSFTELEY